MYAGLLALPVEVDAAEDAGAAVFAGGVHFAGAGASVGLADPPAEVSAGLVGAEDGFAGGVHFVPDEGVVGGRRRLFDDVFAAAYCGAVQVFACGGIMERGDAGEGSGEVEEGR